MVGSFRESGFSYSQRSFNLTVPFPENFHAPFYKYHARIIGEYVAEGLNIRTCIYVDMEDHVSALQPIYQPGELLGVLMGKYKIGDFHVGPI